MAIIERKILITDKDANGNTTYDFPITKADNVEGLANIAKTGSYNDLKNVPTLQTNPLKVGGIKIDQPISSGTTSGATAPYIYFLRDSASATTPYNVVINNSWDNQLTISGKDKRSTIQFIESPRDSKKNASNAVITSAHGNWWTSLTDHGNRETQAIIKTNEYYDSATNTYTVGSELHGNTEIKLSVGNNVTKLDNSGNLKVSNGITGTSLTVTGNVKGANIYPVGSVYLSTVKKTTADLSAMFGGTWVQIGGGYALVAANDTTEFAAGKTGGNKTHTIALTEIPPHDHDKGTMRIVGTYEASQLTDDRTSTPPITTGAFGYSRATKYVSESEDGVNDGQYRIMFDTNFNSGKGWTGKTGKTGGNSNGKAAPFSLMQPYFSVYMYYRKA